METKQRIVREALRLFLRKGYDRTSLNDIAGAVGITKPAIYHHFDNKEELFHEVLSLFFEEMGKWSAARLRSTETLRELLEAVFSSLGSFQQVADILLVEPAGDTPYSVLELFLAASKRDPSIQRRIEDGFVHTREVLAARLRQAQERGEIRGDIDCDACAFQIHALIEGASLIGYLDKSASMETIGRSMFASIWSLIER